MRKQSWLQTKKKRHATIYAPVSPKANHPNAANAAAAISLVPIASPERDRCRATSRRNQYRGCRSLHPPRGLSAHARPYLDLLLREWSAVPCRCRRFQVQALLESDGMFSRACVGSSGLCSVSRSRALCKYRACLQSVFACVWICRLNLSRLFRSRLLDRRTVVHLKKNIKKLVDFTISVWRGFFFS